MSYRMKTDGVVGGGGEGGGRWRTERKIMAAWEAVGGVDKLPHALLLYYSPGYAARAPAYTATND